MRWESEMMEKPRLLICYAHPDDESFGLGGLIAKYVEQGVDVYLICATDGAVGSMDGQYLDGGKTIRDVRLSELDCAARKLNLTEVFMLDYRDSGMMGSPDNADPACLWATWQREPDTVTQRVVEVMRQVRPHVVITFNEYGGYGHPDHIAIQQATVAAMDHVNDETYLTGDLTPYQPQKLYYSSITKFPIQVGIALARLRGKNPRALGRNEDIDIVAILDHTDDPTTKIDVRDYFQQWDESGACHASQGGGSIKRFPIWLRKMTFPEQTFRRVFPEPERSGIIEYDLFEEVKLDEGQVVVV
jgi:N-acetyl-1-D-myo-inositol-2-amino-2-deoxy-alpha-D-glucopyranoside deacetylase